MVPVVRRQFCNVDNTNELKCHHISHRATWQLNFVLTILMACHLHLRWQNLPLESWKLSKIEFKFRSKLMKLINCNKSQYLNNIINICTKLKIRKFYSPTFEWSTTFMFKIIKSTIIDVILLMLFFTFDYYHFN